MSQRRANLNERAAMTLNSENRAKEKSIRLTKQQTKITKELNKNRLRAFAVMTRSRGVMLGFSSRLGFFNQLIDNVGKTFTRVKNNILSGIKGLRKASKDIISKEKLRIRAPTKLETRLRGLDPTLQGRAAVAKAFISNKGAAPDLMGALKRSGDFPRSPTPFMIPRKPSESPKTKAFSIDMIRGMAETRKFLGESFGPDLTESVSRLKAGGIGVPTPFASTVTQGPPKETTKFFNSFNKSGKASKSMGKNVMKPMAAMLAQGAMQLVSMSAMMVFTQLLNGIMTVFQPLIQLINMFIKQVSMGFMPLIIALIEEFTKPDFLESIEAIAESIRIAAIEMVNSGFVEEMGNLLLSFLVAIPELVTLILKMLDLAAAIIPLLPLIGAVVDFLTELVGLLTTLLGQDEAYEPIGTPGVLPGEPGGGTPMTTGNPLVDFFTGIWNAITGAATGAVVNPPGGIYKVGEGGQTEIISPVSLMRQVIREETGGSGGQVITINLTINGIAPGSDINELSRIIARKIGFALQ